MNTHCTDCGETCEEGAELCDACAGYCACGNFGVSHNGVCNECC